MGYLFVILSLPDLIGQSRRRVLFLKQIRVRAHALEDDSRFVELLDEQPVGFDMALAAADVGAEQAVVAVNGV
jgi:hypothetical protein